MARHCREGGATRFRNALLSAPRESGKLAASSGGRQRSRAQPACRPARRVSGFGTRGSSCEARSRSVGPSECRRGWARALECGTAATHRKRRPRWPVSRGGSSLRAKIRAGQLCAPPPQAQCKEEISIPKKGAREPGYNASVLSHKFVHKSGRDSPRFRRRSSSKGKVMAGDGAAPGKRKGPPPTAACCDARCGAVAVQ
jgi:hypothetical protein